MNRNLSSYILLLAIIFTGCAGGGDVDYYPKPRGYIRLDFPEREYNRYLGNCPYSFEIPEYFEVYDKDSSCNKDIVFERFNGTVMLTYIPLDTNLMMNIEISRKFAYEHSRFADAIEEARIIDESRNAYGLKYNIIGNAASPYQFYLTDSVNHFLRGALYFNAAPNYDSIKPSLDYVVEDVDHLIATLRWEDVDR